MAPASSHTDSHNSIISVIIPVYNVEPYLRRCLDSVIRNTYRNLEIICINDGSIDNCLSILHEYEKQDERIIIIDQQNKGLSAARNAGLDIATGDFIAFIDSDDWIHPQYFEILLHVQQIHNTDLICSKHLTTNDITPSPYHALDTNNIRAHMPNIDAYLQMRHVRNQVWARLYRASMLQSHRFIEGIVFEDTPFNLLLLCKYENIQISLIEEPLYFYFMRSSSIVHTASRFEQLPIYQAYLSHITPQSSEHEKRILIEESIKKLLSIRYEASLERNIDALRESSSLLRSFLCLMFHAKHISVKKRLQYFILSVFPQAYRQFRIKDDPTLLQWEKRKQSAAKHT